MQILSFSFLFDRDIIWQIWKDKERVLSPNCLHILLNAPLNKNIHTTFNYNPGNYYSGKLVLLLFLLILKLDKVLAWFRYLLKVMWLMCARARSQDLPVAQMVKNLPAMQETWVRSTDQKDPLEKETATHSSIIAWRIPWTEEPGGLQSRGCKESDRTEQLTHSNTGPEVNS